MPGSEYGGEPGIIQPDITRVDADAAAVGLGHATDEANAADNRGVRDAAMIVRKAGMAEAQGRVQGYVTDPDTGISTPLAEYDEETIREELYDERRFT